MTDPFATLDALHSHVWDRIDRGVRDSEDPFRLVTLATLGKDGPEARIVALRAADRSTGSVEVHSDTRTAKVRALKEDPRAALLFWDPEAQLQVRLRMALHLHPSDPDRWADVPEAARLNYGTDPAPGTPVDDPRTVSRTADIARFVALRGRVETMDVVSLAHDPHRRAAFGPGGASWIAP